MKRKKLFIIKCAILVILTIIYKLLEYVLKINNLAFMNTVVYTFIVISIVLFFSILIEVIKALYNTRKKKTLKLSMRIISGIGIAAVVVLIILLLIYGFVAFVFSHKPEYIVVKDDKKMVAYVNSFLQVEVNYYDYVNKFVRGRQLKINEDYGNGGYDPFKRDEMPSLERYIYFDSKGNVIKSNDKEIKNFTGTIKEINEQSANISVDEGEDIINSGDLVTVTLSINEDVEFKVGDRVRVRYDGDVRETYPLGINTIFIEIIEGGL